MLQTYLWPFLVYYLILFVVSYVVVEYGQNYLYDEVPPGMGPKVAIGTLIIAGVMTYTHPSLATMFTADIGKTTGLAIAWTGVFILIYRFQPWHGFGLAMATLLLFAGLSTLVVDSMLTPRPANRLDVTKENKLIRRPTGGSGPVAAPPATPAPGK